MRNLYWKQNSAVRVADEESSKQEIRRGVRQGCVLTTELFNLYSEIIVRDLIDLKEIKFGGRNINNIGTQTTRSWSQALRKSYRLWSKP